MVRPGGGGEDFDCAPFCTIGILHSVNESPIHKNKEITISVGGLIPKQQETIQPRWKNTNVGARGRTFYSNSSAPESLVRKARGPGKQKTLLLLKASISCAGDGARCLLWRMLGEPTMMKEST